MRIPGSERREIAYIAKEELASVMYEIIKNNVKVTKEGLFNKTVRLLGFSSCGKANKEHLDKALETLLDNKRFKTANTI